MSDELGYSGWHTGVEFDRDTKQWRGYIEDGEHQNRRFTADRFADKGDAAVAASDLLTELREGTPPGQGKDAGLPRL